MARKKQKGKAPRKPRNGRVPEQATTRRGRKICAKGGQIRAPTGNIWDVASQGTEGRWRKVQFACGRSTCECAYHMTGKGCRCQHIAAVEHLVLAGTESPMRERWPSGRRIRSAQSATRASTCGMAGTGASPARGSGTCARDAAGGSGTTWALSAAMYRPCTSRWPSC